MDDRGMASPDVHARQLAAAARVRLLKRSLGRQS
jgi:hypothetical protein